MAAAPFSAADPASVGPAAEGPRTGPKMVRRLRRCALDLRKGLDYMIATRP